MGCLYLHCLIWWLIVGDWDPADEWAVTLLNGIDKCPSMNVEVAVSRNIPPQSRPNHSTLCFPNSHTFIKLLNVIPLE